MKKYLFTLIPLVACSLLSIVYFFIEPKDYPDPSYPFRTSDALNFLSTRWFYIGVILSVVFLCIFLIDDIFSFIRKKIEKWNMKKNE